MFENFYTVFYLGSLPIKVWGFFVSLGVIFSFVILWFRSKKLGLDAEKNIDIGILMVVSGFISARLFHVFFYEPSYFWNNPADIVKIWQGGMSSFGGLFGALLALFIFAKIKKILFKDLVKLGDLFAFSAIYGWMLGRVGCVMIHDHLGQLTNNRIFSALTMDGFRYEMAFLEILGLVPLAIFFLILNARHFRFVSLFCHSCPRLHNGKLRRNPGLYTSVLFIYYGLLRFVLDFFRATDILNADMRYLGLTPGQYSGIILIIAGLYLFTPSPFWHGLRVKLKLSC